MPAAVRIDQGSKLLVQSGGACAQRVHGPPGLGQAVLGHPLGLVQQAQRTAGIALVGQHGARGLELNAERAEGVGEHVVDLAGDARPLVQHGGSALLGAQLLQLRHQRGGLLGLTPVGGSVPALTKATMSSSGNPSALVALAPVTSAPASTPTSAIAVVTQPVSRLLPAPAPMAAMNAKPISGPPCAPMLAKPDAAAITIRAPARTRGCGCPGRRSATSQ
jgi:hypothetical protein